MHQWYENQKISECQFKFSTLTYCCFAIITGEGGYIITTIQLNTSKSVLFI